MIAAHISGGVMQILRAVLLMQSTTGLPRLTLVGPGKCQAPCRAWSPVYPEPQTRACSGRVEPHCGHCRACPGNPSSSQNVLAKRMDPGSSPGVTPVGGASAESRRPGHAVVPQHSGFDWSSTEPLILRRPALAGRLEGYSPASPARVTMVRDARALPALLTMRPKESRSLCRNTSSAFQASNHIGRPHF
jgi:hypothetical protein